MKRLKSSDDVSSYGNEKGVWGRKDEDRGFHYNNKSENGKRGFISSSSSASVRYEEDRKNPKVVVRKRSEYEGEGYRSSKGYDRYRDRERDRDRERERDGGGSERRGLSSCSSPRGSGYGSDRIHRSESFSGPRRDFPKGFRSERDRTRREGSVSSWRRFGSGGKEAEEVSKSGGGDMRVSKTGSEEIGNNVRSPQGGRDVKSPVWSKSPQGGREVKSPVWSMSPKGGREVKSPGWSKSPRGGKDVKSPAWSKDSGSEQSKSVEVKKSNSVRAESGNGNDSEREEGELEPDTDPRPESVPIVEKSPDHPPLRPLCSRQEVQHGTPVDETCLKAEEKLVSKEDIKPDQARVNADVEKQEVHQSAINTGNRTSSSGDSSTPRTGENEVAVPLLSDNEKKDACKEGAESVSETLKPVEIKPEQDNDTNVEVKQENTSSSMHVQVTGHSEAEQHDVSGVTNHTFVTKELTQNFKDKGKSVIVSASNGNDESIGFLNSKDIDMEGPSKRGFDLFFMDPVKKPESNDQTGVSKPKDEKLSMEPLELSLRLPSVLLPIGVDQPVHGPDSPSQEMSIQSHASSFQTSSDGFTRSFSGSQHYTHNPSCSLTETSFDFEQSVGSRPLFQGVVWQAQPSDDHKNTEPPVLQRSVSNGNGGVSNAQFLQLNNSGVAEGIYKTPVVLDRQLSSNNNNKQPLGSHSRHRNEIRSPTQSVGSHDTGSGFHKDRKRVANPADLVEPLLAMVVSEPIHIVARILSEMSPPSITSLKELARDVILNPSKRRQYSAVRKALEKRSDITLEMLLKSHSVLIEILVTLKTGIQDFLQTKPDVSSSDLAEIYLNLRCRNLTCRSYLPVDECDCKICVQKNGFCSACMCLVCSKFDMASNTCSWVGCDVCLHWCHTDCGIRESSIRNGSSATGALGQTEMQFFCVACDHPSEMFGFVREVFQNFAKGWTVEAFAKELEYVRRIFSGSDDIRGKRLHEISLQMLTRLSNKSDIHQVRSYIMSFFSDDDAFKDNVQIAQEKEVLKQNHGERSKDISNNKASQEAAMWMKSIYADRPVQLQTTSSDIQRATPLIPREPVFDELDGIVRIKLAEAQMFQMRADDARREAEGLNRIAQAKSKKIDEEFASRVTKLHLPEAEEIRRQKLEELQVLENAHQEYFNMKVRMEREIKDLLLKMEATKRNFNS
uniref:protein OBERON 4 n=1 Tax=Erigeron canadensis TaxID=72917 RepID=UPI001CB9B276|nr:protein OBERON 4 [Erigeron canadensis]